MYLQHTIAPGTANGGVCVRTPVPLSSRTLGFGFSPTYVTYFHRVYVDSIYPLSKESSVCVCVCVDLCLSLSLFLPQMEVCVHPHPRPRSSPPFPFPFPFFFPYTLLSLSLSLGRTTTCLLPYFYLFLSSYFHLRPQNRESTVSRPICEVKHGID